MLRSVFRVGLPLAFVLLVAPRPASADITVQVDVTWADFAATGGAVEVFAFNPDNGFYDFQLGVLELTGPHAGTATFTFPDDGGFSAGARIQPGQFSLISGCDPSIFAQGFPSQCGAVPPSAYQGDLYAAPPATLITGTTTSESIAAQAGETLHLDFDLSTQHHFGTVAGTITLPPGAQIAGGFMFADTATYGASSEFVSSVGAITANGDGSYSYSVPVAAAGPGDFAPPVQLVISARMPSGTVFSFHNTDEVPAPAPGETSAWNLYASDVMYLRGTVTWGDLLAGSARVYNPPGGELAPVTVAPDGLSGTYDLLVSATDVNALRATVSTCGDPATCDPGVAGDFLIGVIDNVPGATVDLDLAAHPRMSTLSGTVSLNGATLEGGTGTAWAFGPDGQNVVSRFAVGADGAYEVAVGQGDLYVSVSPEVPECPSGVPMTATVWSVGDEPAFQDFDSDVDPTLPARVRFTAGLDGWPTTAAGQDGVSPQKPGYSQFYVNGSFLGDWSSSGGYRCNGGNPYGNPYFDGAPVSDETPDNSEGIYAWLAGPWKFNYRVFSYMNRYDEHESYVGYVVRGFTSRQRAFQLPAGGIVDVVFPSTEADLVGEIDTSRLHDIQTLSITASAQSATGDGSESYVTSVAAGKPQDDRLAVDLTVTPEAQQPLSLQVDTWVTTGPTSTSHWTLRATVPLGDVARGRQLMPGLDAIPFDRVGSWTVKDVIPAGAQAPSVSFNYAGPSVSMDSASSEADLAMTVPAGSYPTGGQIFTSYADESWSWQSGSYDIGGEVAEGDALESTVHSAILLDRAPAPGTFCPQSGASDGATRIQASVRVASDPSLVSDLTIAGVHAQPGSAGTASAQVLLPLGTHPSRIVAEQGPDDTTSWDRSYTVPSQMLSQGGTLGALVPGGSAAVPAPKAAANLKGNVVLLLAVTSCGRPVTNPGSYATKPSLVAVSRVGQALALPTVTTTVVSASESEFRLVDNGVWQLQRKATSFGSGTFKLTFRAPDGSLWDGELVVK